jgi:hypothetical protein
VAAIRPTPGKPIPTAKKLIDAGLVRGLGIEWYQFRNKNADIENR